MEMFNLSFGPIQTKLPENTCNQEEVEGVFNTFDKKNIFTTPIINILRVVPGTNQLASLQRTSPLYPTETRRTKWL